MSSFTRQDSELSIAEQAARWLCELQEGDHRQQAEFFSWLRQSPRQVEEFLFATAMWKKLHHFSHGNPQRLERLLTAADNVGSATHGVLTLTPRSAATPSVASAPQRRAVKWAAAATLILGLAGGGWLLSTR